MTKLPTLELRSSAPSSGKSSAKGGSAKTKVDTEVVWVRAGKPVLKSQAKYLATLTRLKKTGSFTGKAGSAQFVRLGGRGAAAHLLAVGLGAGADTTLEKLRSLGGTIYGKLAVEKSKGASIALDPALSVEQVHALAEGLILGAYSIPARKSEKPSASTVARFVFVGGDAASKKEIQKALDEATFAAQAATVTRDWSNEPGNIGTPEFYAAEASRLAKEYGLKCRILTEKDALKERMELFLAVSRGSDRKPRVIVLEYAPKAKPERTMVLVGKGVTFDAGGISIKPAMRMEDMKHDMTGAATIMGAMLMVARLKPANRVIAILGMTENMPDGSAFQPGNVLGSRSGKTVEIINTDAEGRLVLADLLDYAKQFKPDVILDAATLTGAIGVALGKQACGLFANNESIQAEMLAVSAQTGERMWPMPLFDEYFEDLRSDYADMKNTANDGQGGAIRGAVFLKQFVDKATPWIHLDIASLAYGVSHLSYMPKRGASGIFVRSIARFAAKS